MRLVASDAHAGRVDQVAANLPGATWQRRRTHYAANRMSITPKTHWPAVKVMLHSVYDQPDRDSVHAQLTIDTGTPFSFQDPKSPWQRGTNENTNGLLRQYFHKGTDLARWAVADLEAVAYTPNTRPRKALGWKTAAEVFEEQLSLGQQASVATTD